MEIKISINPHRQRQMNDTVVITAYGKDTEMSEEEVGRVAAWTVNKLLVNGATVPGIKYSSVPGMSFDSTTYSWHTVVTSWEQPRRRRWA